MRTIYNAALAEQKCLRSFISLVDLAQKFLKNSNGLGNMALPAGGSLRVESHTVILKYQGRPTECEPRTEETRNRWGFPDASDKGPQSLIFQGASADEKSKGMAGSIKVR